MQMLDDFIFWKYLRHHKSGKVGSGVNEQRSSCLTSLRHVERKAAYPTTSPFIHFEMARTAFTAEEEGHEGRDQTQIKVKTLNAMGS